MTFYTGENNYLPDGSWASKKTAYDPCPAGWRVPDGGPTGIWRNASGSRISKVSSATNGLTLSSTFGGGTTTIWYPAAGYYNTEGTYMDVGTFGDYWSVTPISETANKAYGLDFGATGDIDLQSEHERSWGKTIRCQKIQ